MHKRLSFPYLILWRVASGRHLDLIGRLCKEHSTEAKSALPQDKCGVATVSLEEGR